MVTQLLRVSSIIFLGATLFTVSIMIISPVAPLEGRRMPAACDKKEYGLMGEKRDAAFHLRVFRYASDHAVFSAAVNIKSNDYLIRIFLSLKIYQQPIREKESIRKTIQILKLSQVNDSPRTEKGHDFQEGQNLLRPRLKIEARKVFLKGLEVLKLYSYTPRNNILFPAFDQLHLCNSINYFGGYRN